MRNRLLLLAVSWAAISIGIPLLVRAEYGVAPFDVLTTGVVEQTGWSFGLAFIVCSVATFAVGWALGGRLGWACVAGSVAIGRMINLVLPLIPEQTNPLVRAAFLGAGTVVIAFGICTAIKTDLGPGPSEVFMLGLVRRGLGVVPARWLSDGLPVVLGVLLGGSLGVGTILFALAMGPLVKLGLRLVRYDPTRLPQNLATTPG